MTLSVFDIANDLGIFPETIRLWIRSGKLKANISCRKHGYRVEEEDYKKFLEDHPYYNAMKEGLIFSQRQRRKRKELCDTIEVRLKMLKTTIKKENRDQRYVKGFERAYNNILDVIKRERDREGVGDALCENGT